MHDVLANSVDDDDDYYYYYYYYAEMRSVNIMERPKRSCLNSIKLDFNTDIKEQPYTNNSVRRPTVITTFIVLL